MACAGEQGGEGHPCSVLALQPKVIYPSSHYGDGDDGDGDDDYEGQSNCDVCRDDTGNSYNMIRIALNRFSAPF